MTTTKRNRHGSGSLRLRSKRGSDGVASWQLRWPGPVDPVTGKRPILSQTFKGTRREASARLRELIDASDNDTLTRSTDETVAQFLGRWLDHAKADVSRKTWERYSEVVHNNLVPLLGQHKLSALRASHLRKAWVDAGMSGRKDGKGGLAPQTVKHLSRIMHRALAFAVEDRTLARNPAAERLARPPKVERSAEIRALTEPQLRALLANLRDNSRLYLPSLAAALTGMRRGEIFGLRWQDADIDGRALHVERALEQTKEDGLKLKSPKTKHSRRRIAIGETLADALQRHKVAQLEMRLALGLGKPPEDALVFTDVEGEPVNVRAFSQAFRAAVAAMDLPSISFHDLRHTHATLLLSSGVNPKLVSRRLGHSSVAITLEIYAHVLPGSDEDMAESFDARIAGV